MDWDARCSKSLAVPEQTRGGRVRLLRYLANIPRTGRLGEPSLSMSRLHSGSDVMDGEVQRAAALLGCRLSSRWLRAFGARRTS